MALMRQVDSSEIIPRHIREIQAAFPTSSAHHHHRVHRPLSDEIGCVIGVVPMIFRWPNSLRDLLVPGLITRVETDFENLLHLA